MFVSDSPPGASIHIFSSVNIPSRSFEGIITPEKVNNYFLEMEMFAYTVMDNEYIAWMDLTRAISPNIHREEMKCFTTMIVSHT